jgi:hypothetical protein
MEPRVESNNADTDFVDFQLEVDGINGYWERLLVSRDGAYIHITHHPEEGYFSSTGEPGSLNPEAPKKIAAWLTEEFIASTR